MLKIWKITRRENIGNKSVSFGTVKTAPQEAAVDIHLVPATSKKPKLAQIIIPSDIYNEVNFQNTFLNRDFVSFIKRKGLKLEYDFDKESLLVTGATPSTLFGLAGIILDRLRIIYNDLYQPYSSNDIIMSVDANVSRGKTANGGNKNATTSVGGKAPIPQRTTSLVEKEQAENITLYNAAPMILEENMEDLGEDDEDEFDEYGNDGQMSQYAQMRMNMMDPRLHQFSIHQNSKLHPLSVYADPLLYGMDMNQAASFQHSQASLMALMRNQTQEFSESSQIVHALKVKSLTPK